MRKHNNIVTLLWNPLRRKYIVTTQYPGSSTSVSFMFPKRHELRAIDKFKELMNL